MLACCGAGATINCPDSAWLLIDQRGARAAGTASAPELPLLPDIQRAATEAIARFLRRHDEDAVGTDQNDQRPSCTLTAHNTQHFGEEAQTRTLEHTSTR
jgi:hypothetical protein